MAAVAAGWSILDTALAVFWGMLDGPEGLVVHASQKAEHLSIRERQIAHAYAGGQSYRQIAEQLFIAPTTVRTHLRTIYRKLGVSTKIELLRALERAGATLAPGAVTAESLSESRGEPPAPETGIADFVPVEAGRDLTIAAPVTETFAPRLQVEPSAGIEPSPAPPHAASPAERRHLTVLAVGLGGSIGLSARSDPEEMRDFLEDYHRAVAEAVGRFSGRIANVMGDEVLVYFGWPRAHEDDAERAIRAALDARASIRMLHVGEREHLSVRIGIASGPVVIGDAMGHETAVVGTPPKLASHLRAFAEPDQIVIDQSTRSLVGDTFETGDPGGSKIEGIGGPVEIFTVVGDRPIESRFEARSGSAIAPMVGRDQELALLLERWALAREGEGQAVLLIGEAGIGKSRIAHALLHAVSEEPHTTIRYDCSPFYTDSVLWPVVQQLNSATGIARHDCPEARLDKLEALLARAGNPADVAPLLADLLDLDGAARYGPLDLPPPARRPRILEILVGQLIGLASNQPVLVIMEDAHWSDPSTLELIEHCLDRIVAARVLILITSRPDQQPLLAGRPHLTGLTLNRLGRAGVAAIVARLGGAGFSSEMIDTITARTDGVPLFVEELTKAIVEATGKASGSLPPSAQRNESVPANLQDALEARLDGLGPAKELAQIGAVIGRSFSFKVLAAVCERTLDDLRPELDRLVRSELVTSRGSPPEATYTFKHALIRDAAYISLLRGRRETLHARVADCLAVLHPEVAAAEPELLAHHYTEANLAEKAVPLWLQAGRSAAAKSANLEAVAHASKGLDLLSRLPQTREHVEKELALRIVLGPAILATRGFGDSELVGTYERARELAEQLGDDANRFTALWGLWIYHLATEQFTTAEALSTDLLSATEGQRDSAIRLQAHHAAWTTDFFRGGFASCLEHAKKGESCYDRQRHHAHKFLYGGHDPAVCGLSFRALAEWLTGFPDRALASSQQAVELATEIGHSNSLAQALMTEAIVHHLRGEAKAAREMSEATFAISAEHGLGMWAPLVQELGRAGLTSCGKGGQELDAMRESIGALRRTGVGVFGPFRLATYVQALRTTGQLSAEALDCLDCAQSMIDRKGETWFQAEIFRLRGEILLDGAAAAREEAEAAFQRAIKTAREMKARSLEIRAATSLARHWIKGNCHAKAHNLLSPIYDRFPEGFVTRDLVSAKQVLDGLR